MADRYFFARFKNAQDFGVYEKALQEIKNGKKMSHWMWFIFPQIAGFGHSYNTKFYSIKSADEARAYLEDPVLGPRLREICNALLDLPKSDPGEIFGSPDDLKLCSCMTLFDVVEPNSVFAEVLKNFYDGKRDNLTLSILSRTKTPSCHNEENANESLSNSITNSPALPLMGAVCGDIIGSWYEFFGSTKRADFELFTDYSRFTDDTVCSIAVADALMNGSNFVDRLQYWCRKYPKAGYGGRFDWWFRSGNPRPYNSWGNGSAMRVSAVGAFANSIDETLQLAKQSAEVTHNHLEGIKGAQATALAIYLARTGIAKDEIKHEIESRFGYDLSRKYCDFQLSYRFDVSCQGSVPEAIIAFIESCDYESAVRLSVALGGDADTQAAIAGGIAAAYYGEIPETILQECGNRLPADMKSLIWDFNQTLTSM